MQCLSFVGALQDKCGEMLGWLWYSSSPIYHKISASITVIHIACSVHCVCMRPNSQTLWIKVLYKCRPVFKFFFFLFSQLNKTAKGSDFFFFLKGTDNNPLSCFFVCACVFMCCSFKRRKMGSGWLCILCTMAICITIGRFLSVLLFLSRLLT